MTTADPYKDEPFVPLSRKARREAAKNGHVLPIIAMRMYPDGSVHIDSHGAIRKADKLAFLEQVKALIDMEPDD